MSDDLLGYEGKALKALESVRAEIGDLIQVTKNDTAYEGILIPRSEIGDDKHIVIKINSARGRIENNILQNGAKTSSTVIDLRFVFSGKSDYFCVTSALKIEDSIFAPAMLVITY